MNPSKVALEHHDPDLEKGAVENGHAPVSMTGQLPHRTSDELLKAADTDFPEPTAHAEHSGPADMEGPATYPGIRSVVDGSGAVVWVESHITQGACAYPITPSTPMGEG